MDTVDRTITMLEQLAQYPQGIGVIKLAEILELAPSTVHRYLATLQKRYIVEQDSDKRYRLTARLSLLGLAASERFDVQGQAQVTLERAAKTSQETVCLMVRDDLHAVCVAQIDSRHPLKIAARVGSRQDLRVGATSRVLLAYAPRSIQDRALAQPPLRQHTRNTTTDPLAIREILERIQQEGHYISHGEVDEGVVAVAAPIWDQGKEVVASLVIVAPEARAHKAATKQLVELIVRFADDISQRLGSPLRSTFRKDAVA